MHGRTSLPDELRRDAEQLDTACRQIWGISGAMFRTAKFLFYMMTLAFTGYLVQYAGVEPLLGMAFAALLISGPEGVEALLVNAGKLEDIDTDDDT